VRWGDQLDIQPITTASVGEGELTDQKVAGYISKYSTKAAESTGTLDRPVICWRCKGTGHDPDGTCLCKSCHGRATRSRCYSTTLTALRRARRDWRDQRLLAGMGFASECKVVRKDDRSNDEGVEHTVLVLGHWQYIGRGHSPGEGIFARTIADDLAENRRLCRQLRDDHELIGA
jgi:hypothetical protein